MDRGIRKHKGSRRKVDSRVPSCRMRPASAVASALGHGGTGSLGGCTKPQEMRQHSGSVSKETK